MAMATFRQRVALILEPGRHDTWLSRFTDLFLVSLISINVLAIIIESVTQFQQLYAAELAALEIFSVAVFSLEYLLRVWSCPDISERGYTDNLAGRLRYMCSPAALIDLIAIAPFYLAFITSIDLRFLRVFRLLRIFKLTRYSNAMQTLLAVFKEEANSMVAAFFILMVLLVLSASGIHLIEHDIQPDAFGSIPDAMWWAMATLTTVGYGDVTPITPMGKFFGGCITLIGMGMVALPAGILASGFSEQFRRRHLAFGNRIDETLDDGIIDADEQQELERLRSELGLTKEEADLIYQIALRKRQDNLLHCPHCQKPISPPDRAAKKPLGRFL